MHGSTWDLLLRHPPGLEVNHPSRSGPDYADFEVSLAVEIPPELGIIRWSA